jgi:hypothetical protein
MEANDLIFYTDGDEYNYRGGGYSVESIVDKTNDSIMTGGSKDKPGKQGISTIFNSLAIPTTLFLIKPVIGGSSKSSMSYLVEDDYEIQNGGGQNEKGQNEKGQNGEGRDETISDDLYDKLLKMVEVDSKPKKLKTRKNKPTIIQKKVKKTTRRNVE